MAGLGYQEKKDGTILLIGELELKREYIKKPYKVDLHLRYDDYLELTQNSLQSGLTVDEYLRQLIKQNLVENRV